ncbi:MAG: biotin--[acetyl-CoA-carboxylase] ligase [Pseudomonadota bacterium]
MSAASVDAALKIALATIEPLAGVHVFESLPSTNTWLNERDALSTGRAEVALALHQTAGRGRRGKTWQAPSGSGLCLSVAFQFDAMPEHPGAISLALGVSIGRVLEQLGAGEILLKWPNDLVWQDRKLGGILVESSARGGGFRVVAGVGINVALPAPFTLDSAQGWSKGPVDLAAMGIATTIAELAARVIPAVIDALADYERTPLTDTMAAFNRRHWLNERPAELDGKMLRCGPVDETGRLLVVDMQNGEQRTIDSGDVTPIAWSEAS